jgi:hypothetical protein
MTPLKDVMLTIFQPGISVLKWDSVNVDAFLHQVSVLLILWKLYNNYFRHCFLEFEKLCVTNSTGYNVICLLFKILLILSVGCCYN